MTSRVVGVLALALAAAAIVLLLALPASEYDWMRDMDPSIPKGAIVDDGDSHVAAGAITLVGVASGATAAWFSRGSMRWAGAVAAVAVAAIWAIRFAG